MPYLYSQPAGAGRILEPRMYHEISRLDNRTIRERMPEPHRPPWPLAALSYHRNVTLGEGTLAMSVVPLRL